MPELAQRSADFDLSDLYSAPGAPPGGAGPDKSKPRSAPTASKFDLTSLYAPTPHEEGPDQSTLAAPSLPSPPSDFQDLLGKAQPLLSAIQDVVLGKGNHRHAPPAPKPDETPIKPEMAQDLAATEQGLADAAQHPLSTGADVLLPGAGSVARGVSEATGLTGDNKLQGAVRAARGAGSLLEPMIGVGALSAPVSTAAGLLEGSVASELAGHAVKSLGGNEDLKSLAREAGFWLPAGIHATVGVAGRHLTGEGSVSIDTLSPAKRVGVTNLINSSLARSKEIGVEPSPEAVAAIRQNVIEHAQETSAKNLLDTADAVKSGALDDHVKALGKAAVPKVGTNVPETGTEVPQTVAPRAATHQETAPVPAAEPQPPPVIPEASAPPLRANRQAGAVRPEVLSPANLDDKNVAIASAAGLTREETPGPIKPEHIVGYSSEDGRPIIDLNAAQTTKATDDEPVFAADHTADNFSPEQKRILFHADNVVNLLLDQGDPGKAADAIRAALDSGTLTPHQKLIANQGLQRLSPEQDLRAQSPASVVRDQPPIPDPSDSDSVENFVNWHSENIANHLLEKHGGDASKASGILKNIVNSGSLNPIEQRVSDQALMRLNPGARSAFTGEAGVVRPELLSPIAKAILNDKTTAATAAAGVTRDKFAGSLNLDKLNIPDDGKSIIRTVYEQSQAAIDSQRRGTISLAETQKAAEEIGLTPDQVGKYGKGKVLNAEQITAARTVLASTAKDVSSAKQAYVSDKTDANLMKFNEAVSRQVMVQQAVSGVASEAGRALNAMKIYAAAGKLADEGRMSQALRLLQENLGDKWQSKSEEIAKGLAAIPEGDNLALNKFLRNYSKFSTADKIHAYWVANVLSGPATLERKLLSDQMIAAFQVPTRAVSGLVDMSLAKALGRPRTQYAREALPAMAGWFAGLPEGFRRGLYSLKNGMTVDQAEGLGLPRHEAFGPFKIPGRLISAATEFSKHMLLQSEMYAQAYRQGIKEGLSGHALTNRAGDLISNPTLEMVESGQKFAKWGTFTEPTDFVKKLAALRDATKVGNYIIPFIEIPSNIVKSGYQHSPAGLLSLFGKTTPEEQATIVGRALVGSALITGMIPLAMNGRLTGNGPDDPAQRDALIRGGWAPDSIKIGNRWFPYKNLGHVGVLLGTVASIHDAFAQNGEIPTADKAFQAAANVVQFIAKESFFRGLENLTDAIKDPKRYAKNFFGDVAGGFIPFSGAQRAVANSIDNTVRDTPDATSRIQSGIPIMSSKLPAKPDVLGREQRKIGSEGLLSFLPGRVPEDKPVSSLDKEMNRLGIAPSRTGKSFTFGNMHETLTPPQQRALQIFVGNRSRIAITAVLSNPGYWAATDEVKSALLNKALSIGHTMGGLEFKKWLVVNRSTQPLVPAQRAVPERLGTPQNKLVVRR